MKKSEFFLRWELKNLFERRFIRFVEQLDEEFEKKCSRRWSQFDEIEVLSKKKRISMNSLGVMKRRTLKIFKLSDLDISNRESVEAKFDNC